MSTQTERKLYILNAKHELSFKRLFFEGPAGPEGEAIFEDLRRRALSFAPECSDMIQFRARIWELFAFEGFYPADT